jgi:hypothetical protein
MVVGSWRLVVGELAKTSGLTTPPTTSQQPPKD